MEEDCNTSSPGDVNIFRDQASGVSGPLVSDEGAPDNPLSAPRDLVGITPVDAGTGTKQAAS